MSCGRAGTGGDFPPVVGPRFRLGLHPCELPSLCEALRLDAAARVTAGWRRPFLPEAGRFGRARRGWRLCHLLLRLLVVQNLIAENPPVSGAVCVLPFMWGVAPGQRELAHFKNTSCSLST